MGELKNYLYTRGVDEVLDREFEQGVAKGKVKLGENTISSSSLFATSYGTQSALIDSRSDGSLYL